MNQRMVFLENAADDWYERNREKLGQVKELIASTLEQTQVRPTKILEIGCSNGTVLDSLRRKFGSECFGIDPSQKAVIEGSKTFRELKLRVGTADRLPFENAVFDLVLFGHSLYLCDPADLFSIAGEADRVLSDKGFLVIKDFISASPYRNSYVHKPGVYSHKMEFAKMFLWHPAYRLLARRYFEHGDQNTFRKDEAISVDILHKNNVDAFPLGPGG